MISSSRIRLAASIAAVGALLQNPQPAAANPPIEIQTTSPIAKKLTVTTTYRFWEMLYQPPLLIPIQKEPLKWMNSPEEVLFALISAMANGNYDQYVGLWDERSRRSLEAGGDQHRTRLLDEWKSTFEGASVQALRRVEFGEYVIVSYRPVRNTGAQQQYSPEHPIAFHLAGGLWRATEELGASPALRAFTQAENQIERVVR